MLETPEDARSIHYTCMGCRAVVVGTSFIGTHTQHTLPSTSVMLSVDYSEGDYIWWICVIEGMEVAAYMIDMASSVTVIGSSELPYQKTLGPEIGKVTMMVCDKGQYNHLIISISALWWPAYSVLLVLWDVGRERGDVLHEWRCRRDPRRK